MRPALHQVLANLVTPEHGGSPNANEIDSLYKILLYVAAFVFVAVEGTLLYSLIRFRARKGLIPAQIRGNTNLEISWTVAAALILVVLTAVTFAKLSGIKNPARSGPAGLFAAGGHLYASVDQPSPPGDKALKDAASGGYLPISLAAVITEPVPALAWIIFGANPSRLSCSWESSTSRGIDRLSSSRDASYRPRPEMPWVVAQYDPWQYQRLAVPQGMASWYVVNGRSEIPMHLNTHEDLRYIRDYSLLQDLKILWKSVGAVLRGRGAF